MKINHLPGPAGAKGDTGPQGLKGDPGNVPIVGYSNTPQVGFGTGVTLKGIDSVSFSLANQAKIMVLGNP